MLRPGKSGSNSADHISVVKQALQQLPGNRRDHRRRGRKLLIRAAAGATHAFLDWLVSQWLSYSVGFTLPAEFDTRLALMPTTRVWQPAHDAGGQMRDGAWVAEATGLLDLSGWPPKASGSSSARNARTRVRSCASPT
jgi:hypothetical protein